VFIKVQVEKLTRFKVTVSEEVSNLKDVASDDSAYYIWSKGSVNYIEYLRSVFPELRLRVHLLDENRDWDWCLRVDRIPRTTVKELKSVLQVFCRTLKIASSLDACYALGWHSKKNSSKGKPVSTALGQWIHMAKSYGIDARSQGDPQIARLIAHQMVSFIQLHPYYRQADIMVSVPPSNPEKVFDLPSFLAGILASECNIPYHPDVLLKTRPTAQMKYCLTEEEKLDNISGSIHSESELIKGKNVILIDDILDSGITLQESVKALRESEVSKIYGLIATKTLRYLY
jgi:predicted amidophosphoribosyltransferase